MTLILTALALACTHIAAIVVGWKLRERVKTLEPITVAVPLREFGGKDLDEVPESGLIPSDDDE